MKFDIWNKYDGMRCNHTMRTIFEIGMHIDENVYLLHTPFFDINGRPIVEYNFIEFFEPVGYTPKDAGACDKVTIFGKVIVGMVQFIDGCFVVVGKRGDVIGTLKDIVDNRKPIVVGNRFDNKEFFESD